jgi:DICT domain-containing protein
MNEWHSIGHFGFDVNRSFEGLYDNRGITSEAWRVAVEHGLQYKLWYYENWLMGLTHQHESCEQILKIPKLQI